MFVMKSKHELDMCTCSLNAVNLRNGGEQVDAACLPSVSL